jgi:hypothetical protein
VNNFQTLEFALSSRRWRDIFRFFEGEHYVNYRIESAGRAL